MSSFIGHGLAALTIGKSLRKEAGTRPFLVWQTCLIVAAFAPDIDYLVRPLNAPHNGGLRVTHSIAFSLILPFFGLIYLALFNRQNVFRGGLQLVLAGLSHIFLDALVGGREGDPWFYPFSEKTVRFGFGILPSAGQISLTNYYFYRNLLIEGGLLIPAGCLILSLAGTLKLTKTTIIGLIAVFIFFLIWSINLNR